MKAKVISYEQQGMIARVAKHEQHGVRAITTRHEHKNNKVRVVGCKQ
jgi:hypothetical protein